MSKEYASIMEGLNDLLGYAKGDETKGRSKIVAPEKPGQPLLRKVVSNRSAVVSQMCLAPQETSLRA
jgi:hypothetical protein